MLSLPNYLRKVFCIRARPVFLDRLFSVRENKGNNLRKALALSVNALAGVKEIRWGAWSLIAFYLSLLSGIIVGLQYDYLNPFYSTTTLELLAPYGRFFRSLHFYSSQFFFFLCCFHFLSIYPKANKYSMFEWLKLIATLPVIVLLLFTGYILRGDNTGSSAGIIAENIMLTIPIIGTILNNLLFSLSESGLRKIYIHHVIALDLLFFIFAWNHLRLYRIYIQEYLPLLASILMFSVFVSAPMEPEQLGTSYIAGPWFFLGLQELLRYIPPLLAGVGVPGFFLIALFLANPSNKYVRHNIIFMILWLSCYALFSIVAWNR